MWRREMEWLLCVSDHIVEMTPTWQTFPDGTKLEVHFAYCGFWICQAFWIWQTFLAFWMPLFVDNDLQTKIRPLC